MLTVLSIYNKKGLTIVECLIALLLTTITFVSLVSMQSLAWRGAGKSDYWGRATGLLQRELETVENDIMWGTLPTYTTKKSCIDQNGNVLSIVNNPAINYTCTAAGTIFTINTKVCDNTDNTNISCSTLPANARLLNVKITWPGSVNGVKSSIIVSRSI